jgi:hypothetical protein
MGGFLGNAVRLGDASDHEIKSFLQRYAGTYQEDRLT